MQADLACFHSAGGSLQLTATVNGDTLDLGTLTPGHKIMRTLQWPERLTLADIHKIATNGHISMDELREAMVW